MTSRGAAPVISRPYVTSPSVGQPVLIELLMPATRDRRSTMVYGGDMGGGYTPQFTPPMGRPEFGKDGKDGSHASSVSASAGTSYARGGHVDKHAADYSKDDLSKFSPEQLAFLKRKGGAGAGALRAAPAPAPSPPMEDEGMRRQRQYSW